MKASTDYKDSAAAVAKAIDVLSEYYSQAAFVQARALYSRKLNCRSRRLSVAAAFVILGFEHAGWIVPHALMS